MCHRQAEWSDLVSVNPQIAMCRGCCDDFPRGWLNEKNLCEKCQAKRKVRQCLRCDDDFVSVGPHNRLCDDCRIVNTRRHVNAYSMRN